VPDREYGWTDAGKVSATRHGVTEREVIDALYSTLRLEHQVGDLLLAVAGLADSLRVIVVVCERVGAVNTWAIIGARPATTDETKIWMEGTS
jgi:hypothetical protein